MYGDEDKILAIFFSLLMLLQACVIRFVVGTYLIPAALFSLAWFVFTILPLIILYEAPINSISVLYILLCTAAFSLSAVPYNWVLAFKLNKIKKSVFDPKFSSGFIRYCLYASAFSAAVFSTITMVINGWGLEDIFLNLLEVSGRFAAARGNEGQEYGVIGTLSTFFIYMSSVLGGLVSYSQKTTRAKTIYFIIAIAPALFAMTIQSSKIIFLIAAFLYIASTFLAKIYANKLNLFDAEFTPRLLLIVLSIIPLILVSFISRVDNLDVGDLEATLSQLKYALTSYALGQIYAFSDFFSFYIGMPAVSIFKNDFNSYGAYTFAGIFDAIGFSKEFPPGMYEESGYLNNVFETNIFTVFRGLIYDFGGLGSIVFMFLFGLLLHAAFYRLLARQKSWLASSLFVATVVFILMTYLFSPFMARYLLLNVFSLYVVLNINSRIKARP